MKILVAPESLIEIGGKVALGGPGSNISVTTCGPDISDEGAT